MNDTQLFTTTTTLYNMSAVALSDKKVFITYLKDKYLYGIICNVNQGSINLGIETKLCTLTSISTTDTVKLTNSKVFIGFAKTSDTYYYGLVCSVSDNVITTGNQLLISGNSSTVTKLSIVALAEDKVLFTYFYYSAGNHSVHGIICTISGTSITKHTDKLISNIGENYNFNEIISVALNSNKVVVIYSYYKNSEYSINTKVCEISDKSITLGGNTFDKYTVRAGIYLSAVALSESIVLVTFSYDSNAYLYGKVFIIDGTIISKGTDTQLSLVNRTGITPSLLKLDEQTVLVGYEYSNNSYLYITICSIIGTAISKGADTQLSSTSVSGVNIRIIALVGQDILILHSYGSNYTLGAIITDYLINKLAKTITSSTERIDGIAIGDGQTGEMVQIKTPIYN